MNDSPHTPDATLEREVARALEYDIIFGRLSPGERLREETIARQLHASRHHVRSALMMLERAGIVVRERHKGARVQAYSPEEVRQLYDVREMLTRQAALKIALPVAPETLARVQAAQDAYERAIAEHRLPAIHEANDRFHMEVFRLCDNPYLVDLLKRCMDMTYVIRAANITDKERLAAACQEHRTMISLLSGSDSWALAELSVAHLRPSKEAYLKRLETETARPARKRARSARGS